VQQVADWGDAAGGVFGRTGLVLHRQALGVDSSPVRPPSAIPHLTKRANWQKIRTTCRSEARAVFARRRGAVGAAAVERAARKLQLDLLYSDFKTGEAPGRCAMSTIAFGLVREAEVLFLRILTRRIRVRAIEVRFEDFSGHPTAELWGTGGQMGLFDDMSNHRRAVAPTETARMNLARSLDESGEVGGRR